MMATDAEETSLPLESSPASTERGWSVRLPVRAENISVDKEVVIYERVVVDRRQIEELIRLSANVDTEELRVTAEGNPRMSPGTFSG